MTKIVEPEIKEISKESINISELELKELKKILPHVFTENKIDFDKLKATLSKHIDDSEEKYYFNWSGRKKTFQNIQKTTKETLIPVKEESVDFNNTENIFIEGENLKVLKLLQRSYFNKIQMIYIDPPYNTGNDFVFDDDFKSSKDSYLEQSGQLNDEGVKSTTNLETNGRFHSNWISMMYPRLFVSRNLLTDDGVIFVSIGERELYHLRIIMNEIFGEENYLTTISRVTKAGSSSGDQFSPAVDYIVVYARDETICPEFIAPYSQEQKDRYKEKDSKFDKLGPYITKGLYQSSLKHSGSRYYIECPDGSFAITPKNKVWRWNQKTFETALNDDRVVFKKVPNSPLIDKESKQSKWNIYTKTYLYGEKERGITPKNYINEYIEKIYNSKASKELKELEIPFDYPKPSELIKYLISFVIKDDAIILDFFAGSGTTAQSVLDINFEDGINRKFILVQLPEFTDKNSEAYRSEYKTISEICKERIRRVIKKFKSENKGKLVDYNVDIGFKVFKLSKSNYKVWEDYEGKDPEELKEQLRFFDSPLVEQYKNIDVIYECIIKEGFSLNSKIVKENFGSNIVYKVIDDDLSFLISLDPQIKDDTIDSLNLGKDDIFICIDGALDDSKKLNLAIQCNLKTI